MPLSVPSQRSLSSYNLRNFNMFPEKGGIYDNASLLHLAEGEILYFMRSEEICGDLCMKAVSQI